MVYRAVDCRAGGMQRRGRAMSAMAVRGGLIVAVSSSILTQSQSSIVSRHLSSDLTDALSPAPPLDLERRSDGFRQVGHIPESDGASELFARKHGLVMKADDYMNVRMHTTA